jgi:oligoendopeptidase F
MEKAWKNYLDLCKAGGSKPFLQLLKMSGLESPFEDGCIQSIVYDIENFLDSIDDNLL